MIDYVVDLNSQQELSKLTLESDQGIVRPTFFWGGDQMASYLLAG